MLACLDSKVQIRTLDNPCDLRTRKSWTAAAWRPILEYAPAEFRKDPNLRIIHNGALVHREEWPATMLLPGDEAIFYRSPGEAFVISLAISLILMGVSYGVQTALAPSVKPLSRELNESPTYGWDATFSTVAPGTPIPIIYGAHRVGGHIIQQYQQEIDNPAHPRESELHTLLALCAGPIQRIEDVYVNGNDSDTFGGPVATYECHGENHQRLIGGFQTTKIATACDADLVYGTAETIQTTNEVDGFEVAIRFPGGLYRVNDRGNYQSYSVILKFEWWPTADPADVDTETVTVTDKTRNSFEYWFRRECGTLRGRSQHTIRITRQTIEDSDASRQSQTQILTLNDILDEPLSYPGVALLGLAHLPSARLSGQTPNYSCLVYGKLVKVFTTLTDYTVTWSDNPAWCLRDYMLDPTWGLGAWITESDIDQQAFLDWANFCDEMVAIDVNGTLEKRFRLNIVLDGSMSVIDAIRQITSTGRAWILQRGDKWSVKIDKEEDPVQFFSMGRVIKGSFSTSKVSKIDLTNVFNGEYYNSEMDYEQDNLPKEDPTLEADENPVEKSISLIGTTSTSQANRLLNYYMLSNRLVRRQIEFAVGAEALALEAGDVFRFAHDVPGWGWSGRLLGVDETGTYLTLDRTITLEEATSYEITVIHPGTDTVDRVYVTSPAGTVNQISVSGDWTQIPVIGTDYSLGPVSQSTVLYRATSVTVGPKPWQRRVKGREYNPDVYGTDLTVLTPPSVTRLTDPGRIPPNVRDLNLQERQVFAEDGTLSCAIDVHFTLPAVEGVHAEVYWREEGSGSWISAGPPVSMGYLSIVDNVESPSGSYEISVVTVSASGNRGDPDHGIQGTITTVGTTRQPGNVVNFFASRTLNGLVFSWDALDPTANFDLAFYELRNGPTWDSALLIGKTTDSSLETSIIVSGSQTYLIRACNTAGKYSPASTTLIMEVEGRIGENIILTRTEETSWTGSRENFTLGSGKLTMNTEASVVAWRAQQTVAPLHGGITPGGYGLGFRVSGSYTSEIFSVASDAIRCLVSTEMELNQVDTTLTWASLTGTTWDSDFARSRQWSVAPEGRVAVKLEMRFSTTTSDESAFGAWQERPQNIEVLVKYAQVRVTVTIRDPAFTCELASLHVAFDVPDVTESGSVDTTAVGTVAVVYEKAFNAIPKVTVTIVPATAGDDAFVTSPAKTGFSIEVKNGGSRVVRSVHWHAIGY